MNLWLELLAAYVAGLSTAVVVAVVGGRWYARKKLGALLQLIEPPE